MASVQPIRGRGSEPIPIKAHALDNLRYIRETMERAGSFTAVPGWGGVEMGLTAFASALGSFSRRPDRYCFGIIHGVSLALGMAIANEVSNV